MAKSFFIDNQLREYSGHKGLFPYLTYKKQGSFKCIYCFKQANSKEHIPSKFFLMSHIIMNWQSYLHVQTVTNPFQNRNNTWLV